MVRAKHDNDCTAFSEHLEASRALPPSERRLVRVHEDWHGTAGIGDRIKGILTLASLAASVSAMVWVPPPCMLLEVHHLCRVQLQSSAPSGCNASTAPALPCSWTWARYFELRPPAFATFASRHDEQHAEQQLAGHRIASSNLEAARSHLAQARQAAGGLLWRIGPGLAHELMASEPHCEPHAVAGAPVRKLKERFLALHGLVPQRYAAFHIRREGCIASMADVARIAAQLRSINTSTTTAAATATGPAAGAVRLVDIDTLVLFTDEPSSEFFAQAQATLSRTFGRILRLDESTRSRGADAQTPQPREGWLVELAWGAPAPVCVCPRAGRSSCAPRP